MKGMVLSALVVAAWLGAPGESSAQVAQGKNDISTFLFLQSSKPTDDAGDRETFFDWRLAYARFLTDRFAVGPLFGIFHPPGGETSSNIGGLVRYHFGDTDAAVIPFAEFNTAYSINDPVDNFGDIQILGGVVLPMGRTGGRFRIAPYYYRAFYDEEESGIPEFSSFGVTFGVGLLF
jgi:hypothetical protein